ncbi:unnamed protein product, partial [Staurois parvus]
AHISREIRLYCIAVSLYTRSSSLPICMQLHCVLADCMQIVKGNRRRSVCV